MENSTIRPDSTSWSLYAMTLLVLGILGLLGGAAILFTTGNIFMGILGGSLGAAGAAFLAGFLVVMALRR